MDNKKKPQDTSEMEFGKKIFFVYPTPLIQNQVILELVQHEYEAYTAKDHKRLAYALKKYPDSIIFIVIDEKIALSEWEKWVAGVLKIAPDTKLGVFYSIKDDEIQSRLKNITCGFFQIKHDMSQYITIIREILERLNARGRRKYLRACMDHETNAVINIPFGGDYLNGVIKDISIVGFSCVFKQDPAFSAKTLIKDIQLKLQTMLLKVEAVVFGSRDVSSGKLYVMIYTQRTDPDVRTKIRKYIQTNLQQKMDSEINS
ncbi:MAG: pilus assembly protein PilZ [Treponema sp.]|jgi:hypothetical protein|nr:pilus assembly protein PilZ [Treponema sp.]